MQSHPHVHEDSTMEMNDGPAGRRTSMDQLIRRFAGVFVLLSVAGAIWLSPWWLAFTAFVGLNLLQSSFTGICPLESVLRKLGVGTS